MICTRDARNPESINLLLVEDNPGDARLLTEALGESPNMDFNITKVERLKEAVSALKTQGFHALLLDLFLPDVRGLETVKKIHEVAPGLPIVIMTGLDDEDVAIRAVQLGAQEYLVKGQFDGRSLARTVRHAIERQRMLVELADARERERYLATHDCLTDLPNRHMFLEMISQAIEYADRYDKPLAVFFLDLDNFKEINDTYGHEVGDRFLKAVARRLHKCVRKSDTVARFGGDEFTVLLTTIKRDGDEATVARKILDVLRRPHRQEQELIPLTASIGIAVYPRDGENPDELLRNADSAMYDAKQSGGDDFRRRNSTGRDSGLGSGRDKRAGTR